MGKLLREIELGNGLCLQLIDDSSHYYGGFYRVCVKVCCEIPVCSEYCNNEADMYEALNAFGENVCFSKKLEMMGVLESDMPAIREQLINQFFDSARGYLSKPNFPSAFIAAEIEKHRKKKNGPSVRFSR